MRPPQLRAAFRVRETELVRAIEVLRRLEAAPLCADAIAVVREGDAVLLGLAFDLDQPLDALGLAEATRLLKAVFEAANLHVESIHPVPEQLLSCLGGRHD